MRKFTEAFSLLAVLALGACGEDPPTYVPPKNQIEDPIAYFGMAPCSCYEYAPADEWAAGENKNFSRKLGVAVENIGGSTRLGRDYHRVRFRIGGVAVREEYLDPTNPLLLIAGVNPTGVTNDPVLRFDPPATLIEAPPESGQLVRSKSVTSLVSPTETEEGSEVTVIAQARTEEEVEIGVYSNIEQFSVPETVTALPISYGGVEGLRNQVRWFVPEMGFVKLEMELAGETNEWVLVKTRMLDPASCDYEGGPTEPVDECGI